MQESDRGIMINKNQLRKLIYSNIVDLERAKVERCYIPARMPTLYVLPGIG
jgi:hypothetical protein